jgi:hypothetical protein
VRDLSKGVHVTDKTDLGFRYPDIVRAGIHLVLDTPADVRIRVDPDGEKKAEERAARRRSPRAEAVLKEIVPDLIRPLPPLKTVHVQWLDTSYGGETWRDAALHIDLERRRIHDHAHLLGGGHRGSGAIGVLLFSVPVLIVLSPYLYARSRIWRAKERKHGMSRHAVVLMEKLEGQLDAETDALLREALRNDWTHHRKMTRRLTMTEACALLDACALTERRSDPVPGDPLRNQLLQDLIWTDADGDMVAHVQLVDGQVHHARFLGSAFEDAQVMVLAGRFRTRTEIKDDDD